MTEQATPTRDADAHRLQVGRQVRRWRTQRGMTLANVSRATGLNIGYLSQIENDKASPSLSCLGSLADALDVPAAWFFMDDTPAPVVVRASERPVTATELGRVERVDGGGSRDVTIVQATASPGGRVGAHTHSGDEHHIVLQGQFRMTHGTNEVEVGPGDYVRWDGSIPHEGEVVGDEPASMLIVRIRGRE